MVAAHSGRFFGMPMTAGHVYTVAGYGSNAGHVRDGVPATHSAMTPFGATTDPSGNLVLAPDYRIRVVAERSGTFYGRAMKAGYIYTLAGPFPGAHSVAIDGHGNILELDTVASVVRLYAVRSGTFYGQPVTAGHTYVVAGRWHGRANLGDGGPATSAWLGGPQDIATGPGGRLLIGGHGGGADPGGVTVIGAWARRVIVTRMPDSPFTAGSTVVRRDTLGGKIWSATPYRLIRDSGRELMIACWPGVEMLAPTTWIEWLLTGNDSVRKQAIPNLVSGQWELGRWTWRDTTLLSLFGAGEYFSVHRFFGAGQRDGRWYVNFERPSRRTPIGIDTFDLLLDLVVEPDLSGHTWKDEDEYAQARRLGLIDDTLHSRIEHTRGQVLALIEGRSGPFAADWSGWRPDPAWPDPVLPANALTLPATP